MNPSTEQTDRMSEWIFGRILALVNGLPSPPVPPTIREDVRRGANFSEIFTKCGPNFVPSEVKLRSMFAETGNMKY